MIEPLQDVHNRHFDPYPIDVKDDETWGLEIDDLLVHEMCILRNWFGDLIKILVDAVVAFNLTEVFVEVSPLKIEEFVVDQGLDFNTGVQVYGILCADLYICGLSGGLKDPNCHEVSTGKILILY